MAAMVVLVGGCRTLNGDPPPPPSAGGCWNDPLCLSGGVRSAGSFGDAYGPGYGGGRYVQIDSDTVCDYAARACYKWSGQRQRYRPDLNKTEAIFGERAARAAARRWGWDPPELAQPAARPAPPIASMPPPPTTAPPPPSAALAQPPTPPTLPTPRVAQPPTPPTGVSAPPPPPRAARGDAAERRDELRKRRQGQRSGQSSANPSSAGDAAAGEP
jgi:hypothetical protein